MVLKMENESRNYAHTVYATFTWIKWDSFQSCEIFYDRVRTNAGEYYFNMSNVNICLIRFLYLCVCMYQHVLCVRMSSSQSAFTCSKLTIETQEQGVKYVQR